MSLIDKEVSESAEDENETIVLPVNTYGRCSFWVSGEIHQISREWSTWSPQLIFRLRCFKTVPKTNLYLVENQVSPNRKHILTGNHLVYLAT